MKNLINLINIPLYWLSSFVPKNRKIWLFGSWWSQKYADNPKYFFEYVNEHDKTIRAIWLTSSKEVYKKLRNDGFRVYMKYSLLGYFYSMRAGYAFITLTLSRDLNHYVVTKRTKVIQLWHGIPLKKIGFDDNKYCFKEDKESLKYRFKKLRRTLFTPFRDEKYHYIISTAENTHFDTAFDVPKDKIAITGYPRNDSLFKKRREQNRIKAIYMPTFRGKKGSEIDLFESFGFDLGKMSDFLEKNGVELYLKLHPVNRPKDEFKREIDKSKFIHFLQIDDIYDVLYDMDILLTDFSSVYIDFLLTKRPIIFTPFNMGSYVENDRELYYEYDEVTPGAHVDNWDEVIDALKEVLSGNDRFIKTRKEITDRFHKYQDGRSSQRLYELLSRE